MSALHNSLLIEIAAAGAVDGYGDSTGDGTALWEGSARGYLREVDKAELTGGAGQESRSDATLTRVLVFSLLRSEAAPVLEAAGDDATGTTVVISDGRTTPAVDRRFRVVAIENSVAGSRVDSVRLELADERAA